MLVVGLGAKYSRRSDRAGKQWLPSSFMVWLLSANTAPFHTALNMIPSVTRGIPDRLEHRGRPR